MRTVKPWSDFEKQKLIALRKGGKRWTEIARDLGRTIRSVERFAECNLNIKKLRPAKVKPDPAVVRPGVADLAEAVRSGPTGTAALCEDLGVTRQELHKLIKEGHDSHSIEYKGGLVSLGRPAFGSIPLDMVDSGEWIRIGLVADTHLGCDEERLDALHNFYDVLERENIKNVFHAGNLVDGYIPKINGASAHCTTIDDQTKYTIDNYPQRKGMVTNFITGDDHEGWWIKTGLNWGRYMEQCAREAGREDLRYIGHVESDVEIIGPDGTSVIMKVQHPGGGSSYARSYTAQKQVESFEGGEKPSILVQGHYHVSNYMQERNVHVVGMPGFQAQTVFARKKRLRMEVGGAIIELKIHKAAVTRFRIEFTRYFDRGFYRQFLRSDSEIVKGRRVTIRA